MTSNPSVKRAAALTRVASYFERWAKAWLASKADGTLSEADYVSLNKTFKQG